tara:strand:- start:3275 stop:4054 length:780 start_codon:yes stop_codon:yes gene_type:complete
MLRTHDVSVEINEKKILENIKFEVPAGKVTALIGPNGAGKSTLMRAISGEISYQGKIFINERDINSMKSWELAAIRAVLPQSSSVAFPFTVAEVIHIGLRNSTNSSTDHLINDALDCVGLLPLAEREYSQLSGGEQQRVQLARVLAQVWSPLVDGSTKWIFLDEPVSSLDISYQLEVMDIMKNYANQGGGVLTIMHDLNLTAMYADNVGLLHNGKLLCFGAPSDVMNDKILSKAYSCKIKVNETPKNNKIFILPQATDT